MDCRDGDRMTKQRMSGSEVDAVSRWGRRYLRWRAGQRAWWKRKLRRRIRRGRIEQ